MKKNMNIRSLLAATLLFLSGFNTLMAKVTLPPFFSDHMVLQHSADVKLWGTAEPGATVKVKASWKGAGP